jgi:pilus assembly protein Flp/PilA
MGFAVELLRRFIEQEDAATAIEYGLIAGLVAVGLIAAMTVFGQSLLGLFEYVRDDAGGAMDRAGL